MRLNLSKDQRIRDFSMNEKEKRKVKAFVKDFLT